MNMENVARMAPLPVEPLPGVSAYVSETLDDTAAMLSRVLDIIEGDADGGAPTEKKDVRCFRDSLEEVRRKSDRVNRLARKLLETFQA